MLTMAEATTSPSQRPLVDLLARVSAFSATIALIVYILGFIVTSLHYASFGVPQSNPLKPQVVAAGVWTILLLGIPVLLSYRTRPAGTSLESFVKALTYNCFLLWMFISLISQAIAFEKDRRGAFEYLLPGSLLLAYLLQKAGSKVSARIATALSWAALATVCGACIYSATVPHSAASVLVWLLLWGGFGSFYLDTVKTGVGNPEYYLFVIASMFLTVITLFSFGLYPRIYYTSGGGKPMSALICFSKQSDILAGQQVRANLLEQTDSGYYITEAGHGKALFIPNSAVAWVYYGDQSLDLKNIGH